MLTISTASQRQMVLTVVVKENVLQEQQKEGTWLVLFTQPINFISQVQLPLFNLNPQAQYTIQFLEGNRAQAVSINQQQQASTQIQFGYTFLDIDYFPVGCEAEKLLSYQVLIAKPRLSLNGFDFIESSENFLEVSTGQAEIVIPLHHNQQLFINFTALEFLFQKATIKTTATVFGTQLSCLDSPVEPQLFKFQVSQQLQIANLPLLQSQDFIFFLAVRNLLHIQGQYIQQRKINLQIVSELNNDLTNNPEMLQTFVKMLWPTSNSLYEAAWEQKFAEFVRKLRIANLMQSQIDAQVVGGQIRFVACCQTQSQASEKCSTQNYLQPTICTPVSGEQNQIRVVKINVTPDNQQNYSDTAPLILSNNITSSKISISTSAPTHLNSPEYILKHSPGKPENVVIRNSESDGSLRRYRARRLTTCKCTNITFDETQVENMTSKHSSSAQNLSVAETLPDEQVKQKIVVQFDSQTNEERAQIIICNEQPSNSMKELMEMQNPDAKVCDTTTQPVNASTNLTVSGLQATTEPKNKETRPQTQKNATRQKTVQQDADHYRFMDPLPSRDGNYNLQIKKGGSEKDPHALARARRQRILAYQEQLQRWQRQKLQNLGKPSLVRGLSEDI